MPHSLASLEALAGQESLSLLDRFKVLRIVADFVRGLNIDRDEVIELSKLALALFRDFTAEKFWEFFYAVLDAIEAEPTVGAQAGVGAISFDAVVAFLYALLDLLSKFFAKDKVA